MKRKQCRRCLKNLPRECFGRNRGKCKQCRSEIEIQRYISKRSAVLIRMAAYRKRHRDKVRRYLRAYYRSDPERQKQYQKEYRSNPSKAPILAAHHARRRARLAGACMGDARAVTAFYRAVRLSKIMRCFWCQRVTPPAEREVDHIVPLSRGGSHAVKNLCCACWKCNSSKRAQLPSEFKAMAAL